MILTDGLDFLASPYAYGAVKFGLDHLKRTNSITDYHMEVPYQFHATCVVWGVSGPGKYVCWVMTFDPAPDAYLPPMLVSPLEVAEYLMETIVDTSQLQNYPPHQKVEDGRLIRR